jgi:HSP20 family protein
MDRLRRRMNRLWAGWPATTFPLERRWRASPSYPAMNVWANDEGGMVTAEMPGVDPQEIDISVEDDTLTLRGTRQAGDPEEDVTYHRRERGSGTFARSVQLPFRVEADEVEASFDQGVLTIELPRAESDKPHKIAIQSG